jgi:DNA-binding response OmpR family regulator
MRKFEKNRTRLLLVCKDQRLSNDLVTLLTGYGYYVDYVATRKEGVHKFKQYKQAIVIFDVASLPRYPSHLFRVFRVYMSSPKILIIAKQEEEELVYPYLNNAVYDIIQLPLRFEYLNFTLRRLVTYDNLCARFEFLSTVMKLVLYTSPLWIYFIIVLTNRYIR